jgi:hypothetical protein
MPSQPSTKKPPKPKSSKTNLTRPDTKANLQVPEKESGYDGGSEPERINLHRVIGRRGNMQQVYGLPDDAVAAKVIAKGRKKEKERKGGGKGSGNGKEKEK